MKKILIVDDEREFRENISEILDKEGYYTEEAACAAEAVKKASTNKFDVVLLDYMMPGMNGIDSLAELKRVAPKTKIIMITAFSTVQNAVDAIKKGVSDYLSKPFKINNLLIAIKRVLEEARFEEGVHSLNLDDVLSSLSNSIRRKIIRLLGSRGGMRLMEITRELKITDHTKVAFHLKILKESDIISQNEEKIYILTEEGMKILEYLDILLNYLSIDQPR